MSENEEVNKPDKIEDDSKTYFSNRRSFLKIGATGFAAAALSHIAGSENVMAAGSLSPTARQQAINLGTGDTAILNFAFLLEQLEADFYTRVVANNFYAGATAEERQILTDLRDHEIIHREFFNAVLGANAIPRLTFDFSLVDFNSRDSVLTNSQSQEDTGVSAYNGVAQAIVSPDILGLAGKIASVEGRHAAAIRDLRIPRLTYFAPHPVDFALDPLEVLTLASAYLPRGVVVNASGLPRVILV